jgi:hypothetical protein
VSKKQKGTQWDGKSRVSNDTYRKRWNEIFNKEKKSSNSEPKNRLEQMAKLKHDPIVD